MKALKKYFIPAAVILLSILIFHFFRVIPVTKLWKNYSVLYVTKDCNPSVVSDLLNENGCKDFICLENQKIPLNVAENTPEVALSAAGMTKSDYLSKRVNYFFDRSHSVKVYYIPDDYEKNASVVAEALTDKGFLAGMNSQSSYPWLSILVFIAFALLVIFSSKNRILMVIEALLPVYFVFQLPFYTVASALALLMISLSIFERIFNREGAENFAVKNTVMIAFTGSAFLLVFSTSIKFVLLFIMLLCSEYCIFFLFREYEVFMENRFSFRPVKIRSAKYVPVYTSKVLFNILLCSAACFLILVTSFFSFSISSSEKSSKNIQLPAAKGSIGNLPGLDDYVTWRWEALTLPYRSLNSGKSSDSDTVSFKSYNIKNGLIEESLNTISFNDDFKKDSVEQINSLSFASVEKMMKEQNNSKSFGYSTSGIQSVNLLSIIFMVFAFAVPLVFYFNIKRWR